MVFLIEYNRRQGRVVSFRQFDDAEIAHAEDLRLNLELDLKHRGLNHEVVILQSTNEESLRRAYPRYFESLNKIADALVQTAEKLPS